MIEYEPHELAGLFPPLSPDEFEALAQDIAENGQWEAFKIERFRGSSVPDRLSSSVYA
jgi:hypothetical protein